MSVNVSQGVKNNMYIGTHGNLSVSHANVPALADGDELIVAKLEPGIKLVEVKILSPTATTSLKATLTLNEATIGDGIADSAVGTLVEDVIKTATSVPKGSLSSDSVGYSSNDEIAAKNKYLIMKVSGAAVAKDALAINVYTTAVGVV